jgi:hypothetical protein
MVSGNQRSQMKQDATESRVSKGRLADRIVTNMELGPSARFYDLCCGSGAVAIAAVNAGHPADQIRMWDSGPWGLVWKAIGDGTFDLSVFADYCRSVPADLKAIKPFMENLSEGRAKGGITGERKRAANNQEHTMKHGCTAIFGRSEHL